VAEVDVLKFVHSRQILNFLDALYRVSFEVQTPQRWVKHQVRKRTDLVEAYKELLKGRKTAEAREVGKPSVEDGELLEVAPPRPQLSQRLY
jgi:hypothetical protein